MAGDFAGKALVFQHKRLASIYTVYIIGGTAVQPSARLGVFRGGVLFMIQNQSISIPLSALSLSAQNVRTNPREDIDGLAHSILEQGVLQSLVAFPALN